MSLNKKWRRHDDLAVTVNDAAPYCVGMPCALGRGELAIAVGLGKVGSRWRAYRFADVGRLGRWFCRGSDLRLAFRGGFFWNSSKSFSAVRQRVKPSTLLKCAKLIFQNISQLELKLFKWSEEGFELETWTSFRSTYLEIWIMDI